VNEDVAAAVVRLDKSISFVIIEELHRAGDRHSNPLLKTDIS
jgi:hypothetical protein